MKFTRRIDINLPRETVVALFQDDEKRKVWDKSFISITPISGEGGKAGSVSRILFTAQGKEQELIETILENDLPDSFTGKYEHKMMVNTMVNNFRVLDEGQTRYETEVEYLEFRGFFAKLMGFLFPSVFKRQVDQHMAKFKAYAEKEM